MEIKLTNVARASLKELLVDYQDFLRVRDLQIWSKDSKEALYVRKLSRQTPITYETYRELCETRSAEVVANIALCLIHQTNYLLDQQIRRLEQDFIKEGIALYFACASLNSSRLHRTPNANQVRADEMNRTTSMI